MTRFATELTRLYAAAGRPDYATLVRQGRAQKPPVALRDATLSDWLTGRSVPSSKAAFGFLVQFLEGRCERQLRRGAPYWEQLRLQAQRERQAGRARRAPARASEPAYLHQVRRIAPERLDARETELAELARFCTDGPTYGWWRAPAWSGKSALLSWFVLHPPSGVRMVSFFVTARLRDQGDRAAFVDVVLEQLAALLGEPVPPHLTAATREHHLQELLRRACPLVLVVDGLDEDLGWTSGPDAHSIAALLPAAPPPGLRVIVAGRPDPPLPADVPAGHPLRDPAVVHDLSPSAHAEVVRHDAHRDLRRLLMGTPLQQDLLGLVAASGGGLSAADLAELTGRGALEVADELGSVAGRAFQRGDGAAYLFAHEELNRSALGYLGTARLSGLRSRLHAWADGYAARRWPPSTPGYLLRPYAVLLRTLGDLPRMVSLATDPHRHERLLAATGGDATALAEIEAVPPGDLTTAARLAVHREELRRRNANLPAGLTAVWARLGRPARAEALARCMTSAGDRALRALATVLAEAGDVPDALRIAEDITGESERTGALLAVAVADPSRAAGLLERASGGAALIDDAASRAHSLGEVAVAAAQLGQEAAYAQAAAAAESAARSVPAPALRTQAMADHVGHLIRAGDVGKAEHLCAEVEDDPRRAALLGDLAGVVGSTEDRSRLLAMARERAAAAETPYRQAVALTLTAVDTAAAGFPGIADAVIAQALETAHRVPSTDLRAMALAFVVSADSGRLGLARDAAEELARSVQDPHRRSEAMRQVAVATAETDLARAESLVPAGARADLAFVAARRGDFGSAERLTRSVEDPRHRAEMLTALASYLIDAGRTEEATRLAEEAETTARLMVDPARLAASLIALATAMTRLGDTGRAAAFLSRAGSLVGTVPQGLVIALARALAGAGQHTAAERLASAPGIDDAVVVEVARAVLRAGEFERGVGIARSFADPGWRIQALTLLADDLVAAGDTDRARDLVREAQACLVEEPGPGVPSFVTQASREVIGRPRLAETLARLGDGDGAEAMAVAIRTPSIRARTTAAVAGLLATRGDPIRAARLIDAALADASAVTIPQETAQLLAELAPAVATAGAAGLLDRAEAAASGVRELMRDQLLAAVAVGAARAGDFERAERLARTTTRPAWDSHVRHLGEVAEEMTAAGEYARAQRLITVVGSGRRPALQGRLVAALLARGETDEALRLARSITDPDAAAAALAAVAATAGPGPGRVLLGECLRTGDWAVAAETLAGTDAGAAVALADEFTRLHGTEPPRGELAR